MKYVLLFAAFVAIAQIDTLMKLFDKASEKVSEQKTKYNEPVSTAPIGSGRDVISNAEDPLLKLSPHARIMALLNSFHLSPDQSIRKKVMEDIKIVPKLLTAPLDPPFEAAIYGWRDLLINGNQMTVDFLMDLEAIAQGENQLMIRKFMTVLMDHHLEMFLKSYQRSKDTNCRVSTYFADPLGDEEKANEYKERDEALGTFLLKENLDAPTKSFATLCQLVLRSTMQATPVPVTAPEGSPTVTPVQVPAPAQPAQTAPSATLPTSPATNSVPRIIVPVP